MDDSYTNDEIAAHIWPCPCAGSPGSPHGLWLRRARLRPGRDGRARTHGYGHSRAYCYCHCHAGTRGYGHDCHSHTYRGGICGDGHTYAGDTEPG